METLSRPQLHAGNGLANPLALPSAWGIMRCGELTTNCGQRALETAARRRHVRRRSLRRLETLSL